MMTNIANSNSSHCHTRKLHLRYLLWKQSQLPEKNRSFVTWSPSSLILRLDEGSSGCGCTTDISSSLSKNLNCAFFRPLSFDSSWRLVRNSILLSWLFWLRWPRMNDMGKTDPHAMINKNTVTTFSLFDVTKIKSKFQSTFISLGKTRNIMYVAKVYSLWHIFNNWFIYDNC